MYCSTTAAMLAAEEVLDVEAGVVLLDAMVVVVVVRMGGRCESGRV
jgi:hypothetical protein